MDFRLLDISAAMRPYIKAIWHLDTGFAEGDRGVTSTHTQPLMTKEGAMIFFYRSVNPLLLDGKELPPVVFQGPNTKAYELVSTGNIRMLGIELHALTATILFGKSYKDLGLEPLTPEDIGDGQFIEIGRQASQCYDLTGMVPAVCSMIRDKADSYDFDNLKYRAVKKVICAIGDGTRSVSIADCCSEFGLSHKTLQRYFDDLVGLSPKEYAGVVRSRTAMDAVRSCDSQERLFQIALDCGYANPPHMVLDFKTRGALPPNMMKYLDSLTPNDFNIFHFSKSVLDEQRPEFEGCESGD